MKILKNTTTSVIKLSEAGMEVPASGQRILNEMEYDRVAFSDSITEITPYLNSGDLVVNDGTMDLNAEEGLRYLHLSTKPSVELNGVSVSRYITKINCVGNIDVQDAGDGVITMQAGGGGSSLGGIHQLVALNKGTHQNKWTVLYGTKGASNEIHAPMPWKSQLIGLAFFNKERDADVDIEIYVAPEGGGSTPVTQVFKWELDNARVARKTNFPTPIIFDAGDKIGVYFKDAGKNPRDSRCILYFKIIEETEEESQENHSGDFSR